MTTLYNISILSNTSNTFTASITFNPSHPVFAGHFPGQPIVPGVVLVEIAAATASQVTGKTLIVKEASVIKFLQVIDPNLYSNILLEGSIDKEEDKYKADLIFSSGENIFVKLKGLRLMVGSLN